jgi:hypothetical protein
MRNGRQKMAGIDMLGAIFWKNRSQGAARQQFNIEAQWTWHGIAAIQSVSRRGAEFAEFLCGHCASA